MPSTIACTELTSDGFCDRLHIQYGCTLAGLHPKYDGCGASFDTRHAFSSANGGLVIIQHNELRYELCNMASRAFQPSEIREEPKFNLCPPTQSGKSCAPIVDNGDRGKILIHGL
jgi:hypothetical protein